MTLDMLLKPAARSAGPKLNRWIQNNKITLLDISTSHHAHCVGGRPEPDLLLDGLVIHEDVDHPFSVHQTHRSIGDKQNILHFLHHDIDPSRHAWFYERVRVGEFDRHRE